MVEEYRIKANIISNQIQKRYPTIVGFLLFLGFMELAYSISIDNYACFIFGLFFIGIAVSICLGMLIQNLRALSISLVGTIIILFQIWVWLSGKYESWGNFSHFILIFIFMPIGVAFLYLGMVYDCTVKGQRLKYYMFPIFPLFLVAMFVLFFANDYRSIESDYFGSLLFISITMIILIATIVIDYFEVHSIISMKNLYRHQKIKKDDATFFGLLMIGLIGLLLNPFTILFLRLFRISYIDFDDIASYFYLSPIFGSIALIGGIIKDDQDARMFYCKMIGLLVVSLSIIIILILYGRPVEFTDW